MGLCRRTRTLPFKHLNCRVIIEYLHHLAQPIKRNQKVKRKSQPEKILQSPFSISHSVTIIWTPNKFIATIKASQNIQWGQLYRWWELAPTGKSTNNSWLSLTLIFESFKKHLVPKLFYDHVTYGLGKQAQYFFGCSGPRFEIFTFRLTSYYCRHGSRVV